MPAIIKPSRLAVAVRAEPVRDGGLLTVSAFVLFDVSAPRSLFSEQALWPMVQEQMPPGGIFDKGSLKPKGEFVVVGAALAPGDVPVTGRHVTVRLEQVEKRLAVFGDRFWRRTDRGIVMLGAVPFDRMPIDDAHAFGGLQFKANPRGKGHAARQAIDAGSDAPLPNVENARQLIRSIDDNPAPVHFGPIAVDAPIRMRYCGTYDQHWLKTISPLKPDDFNPLFHCDAPEDQRLETHFAGREAFSIAGMTRGEDIVAGRLPGLRLRAFAHRPGDDSFTEIRMVCDTVTLFGNITKATLAFRGLIKSADPFGDDVGTIMAAIEHEEDAPRPAAYYRHVLAQRTDPQQAHKHALSDFQLMPLSDPAVNGARRAARLAKARDDRTRFMENQTWATRKLVEDQGLSPEIVPPTDTTSLDDLPLVAMPSRADIDSGDFDLAELLDDVEALNVSVRRKADLELARAELQRRTLVDAMPPGAVSHFARQPVFPQARFHEFPELSLSGFDGETPDLGGPLGKPVLQPGPERDAEFLSGLSLEIDAAFADLADLPGPDDTAADRQFDDACARALNLPEGSLLHDARKAMAEIDAELQRAGTGLDPGNAGLQPDWVGAAGGLFDRQAAASERFERAMPDFPEGSAPDTAPMRAACARAGETIARLLPNMPQAPAADPLADIMAQFEAMQLPGDADDMQMTPRQRVENRKNQLLADLDEADARLDDGTRLARQQSPLAIFPLEPLHPDTASRFGEFIRQRLAGGHDFRGADLAGADLHGADFRGLDLSQTFFERCNLAGAAFAGANLEGAVFTDAVLDGADLSRARLVRANLNRARLHGATLDDCALQGNTIIAADLTGASLHRARLSQLTVIDCILDGADLTGARIADLQLLKGRADRLIMTDVVLERSAFMALSLKAAMFRGARLDRVTFAEVEAPGSSFARAHLHSVSFLGKGDLSGSSFEDVVASETGWNTSKLAQSCFLRAHCDHCLFNGCDLSDSDLRLASMKNSRFDKSVLTGSDLFGANLFAASLGFSDLTRASLRGANLFLANLDGARLGSCDLTGANLGKTRLELATDG